MKRAIVITGLGVLVAWVAVLVFGDVIMPAYVAAWLAFLALPAGALPIVLGMELAGFGGPVQSGFLRWLLVLMPAAALVGLPVLVASGDFFPWEAHPFAGFAGRWFSQPWFALRGLAYLATWTALAVAALRPPRDTARVGLCVGGLVLHTVIGTLAATDWVMSLSPGLNSAGFGLLLTVAQCALALSAAVLVCRARPPGTVALLLTATGIWATLHLLHYLVVWSADKPGEITYYLDRDGPIGQGAVWFALAALVASFVLLGVARLGSLRIVLAGCALSLLAAHLLEAVWFVIPSVRGGFTLCLTDAATWLVFGVIAMSIAWSWRPAQVRS